MNRSEQLQRIEQLAWRDLFTNAPTPARLELELTALDSGQGLTLRSPGIDNLLFNRTIGISRPPELQRALNGFRQRGISRFFVQVMEGGASDSVERLGNSLRLARYHRSWVKLARGPGPIPARPTNLEVRRAELQDAPALAAILRAGFDLPPEADPVMAALVGRPGWHAYVALERDVPVSVGALYASGDVGYLAFAATLPPWRGQGAQSALLARRIRAALDLGCQAIVTETGEAVPGKPNHSFNNLVRFGFEPVAVRHNYAPPGTTWVGVRTEPRKKRAEAARVRLSVGVGGHGLGHGHGHGTRSRSRHTADGAHPSE